MTEEDADAGHSGRLDQLGGVVVSRCRHHVRDGDAAVDRRVEAAVDRAPRLRPGDVHQHARHVQDRRHDAAQCRRPARGSAL